MKSALAAQAAIVAAELCRGKVDLQGAGLKKRGPFVVVTRDAARRV